MPLPDHYRVLGLSPSATADAIAAALVAKSRLHHPDREGGSHERMLEVNAAREVLGDETRRAVYDAARFAEARARIEAVAATATANAKPSFFNFARKTPAPIFNLSRPTPNTRAPAPTVEDDPLRDFLVRLGALAVAGIAEAFDDPPRKPRNRR